MARTWYTEIQEVLEEISYPGGAVHERLQCEPLAAAICELGHMTLQNWRKGTERTIVDSIYEV